MCDRCRSSSKGVLGPPRFPTVGIRARLSSGGGLLVSTGCLLCSVHIKALRGDSAGSQSGTVKLIGLGPRS